MERKPRKTITLELFRLAVGMIESNRHTLSEISDVLDISQKSIRKIYKMYLNGDEFQDSKVKKKETWSRKTAQFSR